MQPTIFIRCCLVIGLSAALAAALAGPPQANVVGKATRLIPSANLTRATRTLRLQLNDAVSENDLVRTAPGGRARLELADGSLINVGSASELVVHAPTGATTATSLELRYGRVRAWVAPRTGANGLEVRTNTAVAGVLGTTLFVDATRDLTRIANLSAEPNAQVRVTSTDPAVTETVILLPGEGTAVPTNRPPQPARRWTQEEMQAGYEDTLIP